MGVNKREIKAIALRRSGHHAIIDWLIAHFNGKVYHINDISRVKNLKSNSYFYKINDKEKKLELSGNFIKKDLFISNFEDLGFIDVQNTIKYSKFYPRGNSDEVFNLLILRDPYNLFASRYKLVKESARTGWKTNLVSERNQYIWIQHAREFVGKTDFLENKILINYNRWCLNLEYRKSIIESLGLRFTDQNFKKVSTHGGGSSFDKNKFNGSADKMNLDERWKYIQNLPEFKNFFDGEMYELSKEIFKDDLDIDSIYNNFR